MAEKQEQGQPAAGARSVQMKELLQQVVNLNASDLHLCVGRPPLARVGHGFKDLDTRPLTADDTGALMKSITSNRSQRELQEKGSCDFGFAFGDVARFRVNVFRQKGHYSIALRLIPSRLLSFEQIGLPPIIKNLLLRPRGLFLVTGPTGSGKTTSLATMIDFINLEMERHIITVEDPIEYYHSHKKSLISQREIGVDVSTFAEALRRALRQDPDVILVGEMRDLETISAAITAAETGHLVFATLHTTGATRTVDRIIDAFPSTQQAQVRMQLSCSILAVLSQLLLPRADTRGRVAAYELMIANSSIGNLIRENQTHRITSVLQTSRKQGMILLDDHLFELYGRGVINYETMMTAAQSPDDIQRRLKTEAGKG